MRAGLLSVEKTKHSLKKIVFAVVTSLTIEAQIYDFIIVIIVRGIYFYTKQKSLKLFEQIVRLQNYVRC